VSLRDRDGRSRGLKGEAIMEFAKTVPRRCDKCGGDIARSPGSLGRGAWGRCSACGAAAAPALDDLPPEEPVASASAEGCVTCGASDVRYVLIADVLGSFTRMGFCSAACLGSQLDLTLASPATDASSQTKH
jgi:hypothetical protein